jgi:hypothetical protein
MIFIDYNPTCLKVYFHTLPRLARGNWTKLAMAIKAILGQSGSVQVAK